MAAATRYLTERFIADYNRTFARPPADPTCAFVPVGPHDLEQILCHVVERVVGRDNTVTLDQVVLQIGDLSEARRQPGTVPADRRELGLSECAGLAVQAVSDLRPRGEFRGSVHASACPKTE